WQDNGWGVGVMGPVIYFASTGTQTLRVQAREDGLSIDQIVLSSQAYLGSSPGSLKNDSVILPSTIGSGAPPPPPNQIPQVSITASVSSGVAALGVAFTSNAYDPDGYIASYSWNFGDGQTANDSSPWHSYSTAGVFTSRLIVTDNAGASASTSVTITVTSPVPPPPSGGVQFKVLDWNIQMGQGTDYVYDLNRTATYIANQTPDIVTLCEVLRQSWGDDQAQILATRLTALTGVTWYFYFAEKYAGCEEGNLILSKWPFVSTSKLMLSYDRSVARAAINISGRTVNVFATHLDPDSGYSRSVQISQLTNWAAGFSGPRVITGDFNAWPGAGEISQMTSLYSDAWNNAVNDGSATAYPDNPVNATDTRTRRARIDYVFYSGSGVSLIYAKVPDIRDLTRTPSEYLGTLDDRGVRPSDHNMTVVKLQVQ
ncbi:MAG TPA: endonuclease/exonuclease/phosphatase family protein, partial [Blastocatellia bacterium]